MQVWGDQFFYIDLQKVTRTKDLQKVYGKSKVEAWAGTAFVAPRTVGAKLGVRRLDLVWAPTQVRPVTLSKATEHAGG
jgi:hypothetical protein